MACVKKGSGGLYLFLKGEMMYTSLSGRRLKAGGMKKEGWVAGPSGWMQGPSEGGQPG